jgi:hypothetical protein
MTNDIGVRLRSTLEEMASTAPLANPERPLRIGPPSRRRGPHSDFKTLTLVACLVILIGTVIAIGAGTSHRSSSRPASARDGTVTGRLMEDGGPPPGLPRPVKGTITVTGHGTSRTVTVGAAGMFTFALPSGWYTVSGNIADRKIPCSTTPSGKVHVAARRTSVVHVFCSLR